MYTHQLQNLALQELTDDELDALLAQLTTERERRWKLRRRPGLADAPERDAVEDGLLPWSQRRWRCRLGWHTPHVIDFGKKHPRCEHCGTFFQQ